MSPDLVRRARQRAARRAREAVLARREQAARGSAEPEEPGPDTAPDTALQRRREAAVRG